MSDVYFFALKPPWKSLEECLKDSRIAFDGFSVCATECIDQLACARNSSRLIMRARKGALQDGITKGYLSYIGSQDFFGLDNIRIWVSDQGFTDECYADIESWASGVVQVLPVRVVAVNDNPTISGEAGLLDYSSKAECIFDIMKPALASVNCQNSSRVPYNSAPLMVRDVDISAAGAPNATMQITIGRVGAGRFQLTTIAQGTSYIQSTGDDGMVSLIITGGLGGINSALASLFFSPGNGFLGYCPLTLSVWDNGNWGECSGNHECGHSKPCNNYRAAESHLPDVVRTATRVCNVVYRLSFA
jgi:hypothetical protein